MKQTKFYALFTGTKTEMQRVTERTFDKKANKFINKSVESNVSRPVSFVVTLDDAINRAEAIKDANEVARTTGMKLQGVHAFK